MWNASPFSAPFGYVSGTISLCFVPCSFPAHSLMLSLLLAAISVAKCLRTRAVSGFQAEDRPGDARSTLLITLFTGIGLETGSCETAHTAIDLSY